MGQEVLGQDVRGFQLCWGWGAGLDQRGFLKEIIPSDLVPGMGCSLGKSREKGYKALAGRIPAGRWGKHEEMQKL